jgi:Fe-S-cluster containining protein
VTTALALPPSPGPWPGVCNRCGDCCKAFNLPYTAVWLEEHWEELRDGAALLDMVVPIGRPEEKMFRCKHFRLDAGDGMPGCAIHGDRPSMCRRFPYGVTVQNFPRCTWCLSGPHTEAWAHWFDEYDQAAMDSRLVEVGPNYG